MKTNLTVKAVSHYSAESFYETLAYQCDIEKLCSVQNKHTVKNNPTSF